jgi:hypothetical protein
MDRRVLVIVLVVIVGVLLYFGYNSYDAKRAGLSGDVFTQDSSSGKAKLNMASSTPPAPVSVPSVDQNVVSPAPSAVQTVPVTPESTQNGTQPAQDKLLAGDTISPNPPNGMLFAGTGKFQLYRQGNLTWRLNTQTGKACILFATDEEWKKPKVARAGCGKR